MTIIQTLDPQHFAQKARQIRTQVSIILTAGGLLPRFKRWRLTQDPSTGIVVLFGVLNDRYIATHTSIPFRDYFEPRVLHDLANELQVQVVSCNSDGLRYAFILDRGQLGKLPTHIGLPLIENGKHLVRVVYSDNPTSMSTAPEDIAAGEDHLLVHQGVGAFLKVFDDIKLTHRDEAALQPSPEQIPGIVVINEDEFNELAAGHKANHQKINPGSLST